MPDPTVAPSALPADLLAAFPPEDLLAGVFAASATALALLLPVQEPDGEVTDFRFALLSEAAQQLLRLPARPAQTHLAVAPGAVAGGLFAFYHQVWATGQPGRRDFDLQLDGFDATYRLAARRVGRGLLVSFADPAAAPAAGQAAPRESPARDHAALAEAEAERAALYETLMQAPAMICIFAGPKHVFELVNPAYQQLVGERPLLGRPIRVAMPELEGQPIFGLLDDVYRTGAIFRANEMLVQLDHDNAGIVELEKRYYNFIYQPRRNAQGVIDGILVFAYEVTAQVLARQQLAQSERKTANANEELAAANEEMQAANEEIRAANDSLFSTQLSLRELNLELEARVADRTAQLQAARAEAERQRARLERFFQQAPAAICILDGPDLVFELVNHSYQVLFPGRRLLGRPLLEALPELNGHAVYRTLRGVFETGVTHEEPGLLIPIARPADGELENRYFNYIQQARYDERGRIDGVLVFALEVTEQVLAGQRADALRAEGLAAALRQAQERETFFQMFEQTPAAICIQRGPEHRYDYLNAAYQALFPGRLLLGRPVAEALPETVPAGFVALLDDVYRTGTTFFGYELPLTIAATDGSPDRLQYFTFTYQAYRENGQVVGVSTFAYDVSDQITARHLLDQTTADLLAANQAVGVRNSELAATNQQLTRTNQDLDNFVYAASHDLKQPVNNLIGLFSELRLSTVFPDPDEQTLLVPLVDDALQQLATTINDLAAVGQMQRLPGLLPETVDLADLAHEVLQTLQPQQMAARARVTLDFAARPAITYPRASLRAVLLNLLSNAFKYADPARPGRVHLSLWVEADRPVLLVEDNGLGFDVERHRGELFHLFRRFHDHTEGTGVGLYLVNRIVEGNGGRVEVESEVGVGSTFRLYL